MHRTTACALAAAACLAALPAAAQGFDPEAATRAYLATVSGAARARSDAYFEGGYWLLLWNALATVAANLLLLETGAARRMAALAGRARSSLAGRAFVFGLMYLSAVTLLTFPLAWYEQFHREHVYGMSNQSLGAWLGEFATAFAISLPLAAGLLVAILLLVRRTRAWWAWGAGVVMAGAVVLIAAGPVLIQPLFNDYRPMAPGPLRDSILSMARANDVPAGDVFVVDASRQTKRISANVAGLGGTTRIALNDNLLATRDPAAIRSVMGHEIGHYALNHILKYLLQLALVVALAFFVLSRAVPALVRRHGERWDVRELHDPAVVPAAAMVLAVLGLLLTPVFNTMTRTQEIEADLYGLNAAREPDGFARVALLLSQYRKLEPGVWEERIFFTHPSGRERVARAMRWKAEALRRAEAEPKRVP